MYANEIDYNFNRFKSLVPIQFLTGFYVGEVFRRFWDQFMSLPVPDRLALKLATFVPGKVQKILKFPKSWSLIIVKEELSIMNYSMFCISGQLHKKFKAYCDEIRKPFYHISISISIYKG